jgi:hypothetical protein
MSRRARQPRWFWQAVLVIYVLLLAFGYQLRLAHLPYSPYFKWPQVTERHRMAEQISRQIPSQASLSASDDLAPHASHRQNLYIFPGVNDADYVFLDLRLIEDLRAAGLLDLTAPLEAIRSDPHYQVVIDQEDFLLLRRID